MPLTRSAPFTEIPAGSVDVIWPQDTLWPELAPPALRPVQVTVTVPEGGGRRPVMDIVTQQAQAVADFATAFRYAVQADDFEITVRRYRG